MGVHVKTPVFASIAAPAGAASRLKVSVFAGTSASVATVWTTRGCSSFTTRVAIGASAGGVLATPSGIADTTRELAAYVPSSSVALAEMTRGLPGAYRWVPDVGLPASVSTTPSPHAIVQLVIVSAPGSVDARLRVYGSPATTETGPAIVRVGATFLAMTVTGSG